MAHVSFKGSILERKTRLIIYVSVKLSIRMDYKVKMQKLSPLNPLLKEVPWGCNAFAELRSFTEDGPKLSGITAPGSFGSCSLCPEQNEGIPNNGFWKLLGASFHLCQLPVLPAHLGFCNPNQPGEHQ